MVVIDSPVGPLTIRASESGIAQISFANGQSKIERPTNVDRSSELEHLAVRQLKEYFAGKRRTFDLPLDFGAPRPFSKAVWQRIASIPYGKTISYGEIAANVGKRAASRAVGQATGANPIAIVVPCHRVVGSDGSLTGFGGGVERKRWLLRHEGLLKKR